MSCQRLSLVEFLYFVCTSSAIAVRTNMVLLIDVCESSLSILMTLDLGDGLAFFIRWNRFVYFSVFCSALLNFSSSSCYIPLNVFH